MCIDTLLFDDHNCKAGKYMSNCPVCQEDLFSSRDASHEMPCGHAIHWHCFKELTTYDTRCPVRKKTAETPEHMAPTWQAMAMGIALQPVPLELARVVTIICNDCLFPSQQTPSGISATDTATHSSSIRRQPRRCLAIFEWIQQGRCIHGLQHIFV